jgi:hypothetical protein
VSLVPGGIAEMFLWEEHREVIKVRDRKGFVRLAVEQGVPLVPVYHFGNSKLFRSGQGCRRRFHGLEGSCRIVLCTGSLDLYIEQCLAAKGEEFFACTNCNIGRVPLRQQQAVHVRPAGEGFVVGTNFAE